MSRVLEVARAFGVLGMTSFGGPTAHLGYFREEFVTRRKWLSDAAYSNLVALCQFLPGPASSQVGMALGYHRVGLLGMVVAWFMFTAPSSIALGIFAYALNRFAVDPSAGWLQGLLAAAVGVVAHAVVSMGKNLVNSLLTVAICVAAACAVLLVSSPWTMAACIVIAGVLGLVFVRKKDAPQRVDDFIRGPSRVLALVAFCLFGVLLALALAVALVPGIWPWAVERFGGYVYAGALVFGGGHVVLPLMESQLVPDALDAGTFISGYAAAQAVPGPLFTFATFTGAAEAGVMGALLATVAIFLPAGLLTLGALRFFASLQGNASFARALVGVNAAVVGILAATLYDPVFTHGVVGSSNWIAALGIAAAAWLGLGRFSTPPWVVALGAVVLGVLVF